VRRMLLLRHGETEGESSVRFHGSSDVALSERGRAQMRGVAAALHGQQTLWVASTLRRSWSAAALICRGAPVRLEAELCEIHFGSWEGLTREEIQARDPHLYEEWQSGAEGFEFPGGEVRADFQTRVAAATNRLLEADAQCIAAVLVADGFQTGRGGIQRFLPTRFTEMFQRIGRVDGGRGVDRLRRIVSAN